MDALNELLNSDPFEELDVPPQLEESLARHRVHLGQLVRSMRSAGVSDEQIDESVSLLVASYKKELIATMRSLQWYL